MGRSNFWLMVGAVLTLASMFLVNPNSYLLAQVRQLMSGIFVVTTPAQERIERDRGRSSPYDPGTRPPITGGA